MKWLLVFSLLTGCGAIQYSPWQSNAPDYDLTAKHLNRLMKYDTGRYEPFAIAVVGDPQAVAGSFKRAVDILNERSDIDFVVIAGDLTDRGLMSEFKMIGDALERLEKPALTIVGNHDGLSNGSKLYQEMFGPLNYSFIYKDVKFVMWNNNAYEWSVDMDWLAAEVNSHHRVVIVAHQPPDDGALSLSQEQRWKEIRQKPNVVTSIHGHVHRFNLVKEGDLPIYTVGRVFDGSHGIIKFESQLEFLNCTPVCQEVAVP